MTTLVIGFFILFPSYISANTLCVECKGISNPNDCPIVTRCGAHETCYVEQYITNDGIVLFDQGCKDKQLCKVASAFGKRSDTVTCEECCDSLPNSICNLGGCGQSPPQLPTGSKFCFECVSASSPDQCKTLTVCNGTQLCSVQETKNLLGVKKWKLGCLDKKLCPMSTTSCPLCCDDNVCNYKCNASSTVGTTSTQSGTSPTTTRTSPKTLPQQTTTSLGTTGTSSKTPGQQTTLQIKTSTNNVSFLPSSSALPTTVSSPIVMHVNKTPAAIHYGDTVRVACFAVGSPSPSYSFKFRDGPLPTNAQISGNTLILKHFVPENVGRYECVATNTIGTGSYGLFLSLYP